MPKLIQQLSRLKEEEGGIADIDIEFCRFLSSAAPEIPEEVLAAACLTSYAYRQGDVCISLVEYAGSTLFEELSLKAPVFEEWVERLRKSLVVGKPGEFKPLIMDASHRLYLHKLWQYEQTLAQNILSKVTAKAGTVDMDKLKDGINRLFAKDAETDEVNWQLAAAVAAVLHQLTVISGGPGTGKTTTVVRVLALILEQSRKLGSDPSIALAAPTGKAAARLKDSILVSKQTLDIDQEIKEIIPTEAVTIHQLLGARRHSAQFRYNAENPLPYDVVIIDEASMVDQALMSKLLEALLHDTKLILIGDKDQLASVEAGSVLGSICSVDRNSISPEFAERLKVLSVEMPETIVAQDNMPLTDNIILLEKSYRFEDESGILQLARMINRGEAEGALKLLESDSYQGLSFSKFSSFENFDTELKLFTLKYFRPVLESDDPQKMFNFLKAFRILSPHRKGLLGIEFLNRRIQRILESEGLVSRYETWYHGKPIIIKQNDYTLGLNNGDIGICFKNEDGEPHIYFRQDQVFKSISPSRLAAYSMAYALTVHKTQGSEYDHIVLVLPDNISKVITRELLYTAVTRARKKVTIVGHENILKEGIRSKLRRSSGLQELLWSMSNEGH